MSDAGIPVYSHTACELVSSSESSRVVTGSRSGKERRGAPLSAILAPVGRGAGLTFDPAAEPSPRLHSEGWALHAGRLGTLQEDQEKN